MHLIIFFYYIRWYIKQIFSLVHQIAVFGGASYCVVSVIVWDCNALLQFLTFWYLKAWRINFDNDFPTACIWFTGKAEAFHPIVLHHAQCSVSRWKVAIPKIEHSSTGAYRKRRSLMSLAVLGKVLFLKQQWENEKGLCCFLKPYSNFLTFCKCTGCHQCSVLVSRRAVVTRSVSPALCRCSGICKLWTNCIKKWIEVFHDH